MPARKKVIKKEEEESKPEVRLETAVEGTPASSTTDEYAATSVTELGKASAGSVPEVAHAVTVGDLARVTEPEAVTSAPAVTTATPSTTQMPVVMPEVEMASAKGGGWNWLGVVVAFLGGAAIGGLGGYAAWGSGLLAKLIKAPAAVVMTKGGTETAPTAAPSPTMATVAREDLKVQVLNGSGVRGAAGVAGGYLESLGYSIADVGNAPDSDFEETVVRIKSDKKTYWEMLKADLGGKYTVVAQVESLEEGSLYDVVVIVGKK
ncbi:hypothetical protein A2634_01400 [Candidatus Amesbacteria bacterium RIFCSPHIGHO2_01_FULL_48_32]|uniref:LytR/CpsA/Psr regulator C-terminal domain-containing protein n=1 Tax=Candidatus Amesbacteria bacterium RIFCSPLOWO2_01_FULL_48_25 TaxID=1797259 RepID=A0A1F4ZBX4_9BACT|nr:MAG: hypothetical protein A2634_01400 [Candidatus Amesbacteria bacterium RIFCSPHIGHO2_01_FULL_48_32]OGD03698.1 MAG: hypothetical protein A2989_03385 [Candidatus Amesbacteria bacterium RIFCSPLOWO2_01_FULL_48_25]HJZ05953.1 LytR C-terminal domain-containing protein [Patescibacteria group bacterium]